MAQPYTIVLHEVYGLGTDRPVCKKFGCGKTITLKEMLYGGYCFFHNNNGATPPPIVGKAELENHKKSA